VLSSDSSDKIVSSEDEVIDDDRESAGVEVGVAPWLRARASAWETADKYEAAEGIGDRELFDFFLNMLGVGEGRLRAIGEGIMVSCASLSPTQRDDNTKINPVVQNLCLRDAGNKYGLSYFSKPG